MRTVLIHGASTAAGWYDMERAGWANRLHTDALHTNIKHPEEAVCIQNMSIPGTTLLGILKDMGHVSRYKKLGSVTSILAIGLNEAKIIGGRNRPLVSLERFKTALDQYSETNSSQGARELFVGTEKLLQETIVTENGNTFEDDLVAEYDFLLREHAEKVGAPYISIVELFSRLGPDGMVAEDGYHPSTLGHRAIYGAVREALESFDIFRNDTDHVRPIDITEQLT